MARYIALKEDSRGDITHLAQLELEGHLAPGWWYDEGDPKEDWPEAAIGGLIHLFTGQRVNDDTTGEGVEIPDVLGWHIAVLMESWSEQFCHLGEKGGGLDSKDSPAMVEYMEFNGPQGKYPSKADLSYADRLIFYRHAQHRQNIVQQWYSDGIRLYQATQLLADR